MEAFFPFNFILMKICCTLLCWHHKNHDNMSAKPNVKIIANLSYHLEINLMING